MLYQCIQVRLRTQGFNHFSFTPAKGLHENSRHGMAHTLSCREVRPVPGNGKVVLSDWDIRLSVGLDQDPLDSFLLFFYHVHHVTNLPALASIEVKF